MKSRMSRCAALIGTVLSLSSFAQVCNDVSLYKNGEAGKMETAGMTFPESPEWSANWGKWSIPLRSEYEARKLAQQKCCGESSDSLPF